jgi:hypothetical protein
MRKQTQFREIEILNKAIVRMKDKLDLVAKFPVNKSYDDGYVSAIKSAIDTLQELKENFHKSGVSYAKKI